MIITKVNDFYYMRFAVVNKLQFVRFVNIWLMRINMYKSVIMIIVMNL